MATQQSAFTIHGVDKSSINSQFSKDIIDYIDIDFNSRQEILAQLYKLGINEAFIFGNLDSLAQKLCREQGL
ncbi:MAG: hypothetical protein PF440_00125 [Thiomicrorhabdus sp.]|jgi:uncharacterized radical SAM superfamily protein|nr:hypothetical protein [Thiomicrorhabdus sp.]